MSASDHLSGPQFMHISRLMGLPSVEGKYDESGAGVPGAHRVGDVLRRPQNLTDDEGTPDPIEHGRNKYQANQIRSEKNPKYWGKLDSAIDSRDVDPIHVAPGREMNNWYGSEHGEKYADRMMVGNGHHRIARAAQRGQQWLPVTRNLHESGY